ncbi:unnamed protein product, partial [Amoebophrya sp. A25]
VGQAEDEESLHHSSGRRGPSASGSGSSVVSSSSSGDLQQSQGAGVVERHTTGADHASGTHDEHEQDQGQTAVAQEGTDGQSFLDEINTESGTISRETSSLFGDEHQPVVPSTGADAAKG